MKPIIAASMVTLALYANQPDTKHTLMPNMQVVYQQIPTKVDNLGDMFNNGEFYGRLRFNYFWSDKGENHYVMGAGGSLIYKSAYMNGFGFTAGLYTTQNPWHMDDEYASIYKAGKDVLSRYDVLTQGKYGMTSLAQAYLEYKHSNFDVQAGRLIYESFLTRSNDTKMIPNTFEGVALYSTALPNIKLQAAYLTNQKLRDHTKFHHLLAYGDDPSDAYAKYTENDDSAMHQGLTLSKLKEAGIDDRLITLEAKNSSIDNLLLTFNYTGVSDLISSAMLQADYTFKVDGLKITPALRYMRQFDNGAGEIGGANLKTKTFGYDDPDSLEGALLGAKVDLAQNAWKLRLGYTKIADEGDLVAPWRGFPTGGFTRAMAQYNWYANTKTYMVRVDYDFDKAGLVSGLKAFMRYAVQDFDDYKPGVQSDSNVLTLDLLKEFDSFPGLYMKTRLAYVDGKNDTVAGDGSLKSDSSYNEFRVEINYLF
ncbi:OprD family outer membrane porin [Sulfurovum sp. zt1-1]|uniref:OprD family outer membrane porin n=1 Tax=Sulfurovum zhangzhouensis TaxID=3019067 RepID=A0ABT7QYK3_9BACT|nr:OprD family outer membrane porin [Sulfurovum zhangzhouensis]MDM5271386.1 OprD family outer membrane porin [Sulfurovum zhangzhouensis]